MTETSKKYFHELTNEEVETLIVQTKLSQKEFLEKYLQPDWCNYPEALHPTLGCWTLTDKVLRKNISIEFCKSCDRFKG